MSKLIFDDISKPYLTVEYDPVNIEPYAKGNTGIPYLWTFDSGKPGPHCMVCGIMHGNEIAGALVLDQLLSEEMRPLIGKLTFCFGNPKAYQLFDANNPTLSRFVDQDINRVWGKELTDKSQNSYEINRARELFPVISSVDYLLDIHSMQASGPAVAISSDSEAAFDCVKKLTQIPFVIAGKVPDPQLLRLRDLPHFNNSAHPRAAIQIEAGQHWERETVVKANQIVRQFLQGYGLIRKSELPTMPPQRQLKTVQIMQQSADEFHFSQDFQSGTFFEKAGSLIGTDGDKKITTPVDNCYLIMPVHFRRFAGPCGRLAIEDEIHER